VPSPRPSHNVALWVATAATLLPALLCGSSTVSLSPVYHAEGYRIIAQDILKNGVLA
jgi:hypothetical protein